EQDDVVELDSEGRFALAIDPLDGSSNIDVNVSIGTIFSIFEAKPGDPDGSFLRPAEDQIAAGYIIYGPQAFLVVTFGDGVQSYLLDPDNAGWALVESAHQVPERASEFAINASNYRHWSPAVRAYIDDMLAGETGPRDKNFNMRWVASLVAETHRIMSRGGIFLYPGDEREGYQRGRLRMVYECAPIAFVIEQAGGRATDGHDRIMAQQAKSLHARTPFVFGSAEKVVRVAAYHDLPHDEVSALFGTRGLFRA
ncbi:MAG: fructose-1,6-bisphosphatase, partial [Maritimibacter sp.]